ncbi:MAG TPA: metalloregulator ArsR/SmtB family transcription factor [Gemmatimonadaceae bacterium]|nr:metalloregulator ArsR/SmtB family transcription factor [Gemmatimonadaceae bacterium]
MKHRAVKDRLYTAFADTAKALASPRRVEILDLLAQRERSVDALARETGLTTNNTSSHLAVLKAARLVETRKEAQFVFHRLADDSVVTLLRHVQAVARRRLHEVDFLARTYFEGPGTLEPIDAAELRRRLRSGEVTVIDVRPALEYEAGHIAGALSVPLSALDERVRELPKNRPVVAYCRGPYCIMAVEAVERLRQKGYDARRFAEGLPDWRLAGLPLATGAESPPPRRRPASSRRRRAS